LAPDYESGVGGRRAGVKIAAGVTCAHTFIRWVFRSSIAAEANDMTGTRMRLGSGHDWDEDAAGQWTSGKSVLRTSGPRSGKKGRGWAGGCKPRAVRLRAAVICISITARVKAAAHHFGGLDHCEADGAAAEDSDGAERRDLSGVPDGTEPGGNAAAKDAHLRQVGL